MSNSELLEKIRNNIIFIEKESEYSWDRISEGLIDLYNSVLLRI